jgi:acetyltransferase-like isoleucine patch superfamily enzyme
MAEAVVTAVATESVPDQVALARRVPLPTTKRLMDALAFVLVLPWLIGYHVSTKLMPGRRESLFQSYSQSLSLRPGITGVFLRRAFYRRTLTKCSLESAIGFGTTFAVPDVEIGSGVSIGNYCNIGQVTIGDDSLIGPNAQILSGKHQHTFDRLDVPIRRQGGYRTRVHIGRDVWIGNHAIVLEDVADQAVVAAGAIVNKPVPPRAMVAGNPARCIGERGAKPREAAKASRERRAP